MSDLSKTFGTSGPLTLTTTKETGGFSRKDGLLNYAAKERGYDVVVPFNLGASAEDDWCHNDP